MLLLINFKSKKINLPSFGINKELNLKKTVPKRGKHIQDASSCEDGDADDDSGELPLSLDSAR